MKNNSYKDLLVWQKAMEITKEVYLLVKVLPKEETFALSDQIRRAAVSIPSNIAEGQERNSHSEFVRFLYIAQGSRAELETQLMIGNTIGYFDNNNVESLLNNLYELGKMINSLINSIQTNNNKNRTLGQSQTCRATDNWQLPTVH
ncbi:MAG: four helix bundle protein [Bacteroidales bacterium]|nr:four helix bundle protein [Bacteroidales bacterium]MBR5028245.1 four helix bundle protein [Bacteroidales bacterium]